MRPDSIGHAEPTRLTRNIIVWELVHVGHSAAKRGGKTCVDFIQRLNQPLFAVLEKVRNVLHAERVQWHAVVEVELLEPRVSVQVHRGADHDRELLVLKQRKFSVSVRHDDRGIAKRLANGGYVFGLSGRKASVRQKHQRADSALFGQKRDVVGVANAGCPSGKHEVGGANLCEHSLDQVQQAKLALCKAHDSNTRSQNAYRALGAFGRRHDGLRGHGVKTNGRRGVSKARLLSLFRCHTGNLPRNAVYSQ